MNTDTTKRNKKRNTKNSEKDIQRSSAATSASITSVGDTPRDITDTADITRASIAKGRRVQESKTSAATAADITKGQIDSDESIMQGTTISTTEDDNIPKQEEVVSSGTSLTEDKSIDKADIYSTQETGIRKLDKAQEKPVKKVEDKERGSWRIKEEEKEEQRD
jgi:hypothetical protein